MPRLGSVYLHKLRSLMVGTQFAVSSALLILTLFIFNQNRTMVSEARTDVTSSVLVLRNLLPETEEELDLLEAQLRRSANIVTTTRSKHVPLELSSVETVALGLEPDPVGRWVPLNQVTVGHDFFDAMKIPLLAGRTFSKDIGADIYPPPEEISAGQGPYSVVIDAGTAARLGWSNPEQAVGESVYTAYSPPVVEEPLFVPLTVVGVVANRALEIATIGYAPTHLFTLSPSQAHNVLVRPDTRALPEALSDIDRVFGRFYPQVQARPEFLDEIFVRNFRIIEAFGGVIDTFALFSFAIASVGLIGMATFVTGLRQREVGIRKILGASPRRIMRMLLTSFSRPVLISNLVAWPIGFLLASAYLSIFYVQAPVTLIPFLISLALTLGVAVLAVAHQARRSSKARPAAVLRHE